MSLWRSALFGFKLDSISTNMLKYYFDGAWCVICSRLQQLVELFVSLFSQKKNWTLAFCFYNFISVCWRENNNFVLTLISSQKFLQQILLSVFWFTYDWIRASGSRQMLATYIFYELRTALTVIMRSESNYRAILHM